MKLTTKQAALILGVATGTVRQKARKGELTAQQVPGTYPVQWVFNSEDLPERETRSIDAAAYTSGVITALEKAGIEKAYLDIALTELIVDAGVMDEATLAEFRQREHKKSA